ncbi:MAG: DUF655 domain-containing protein [Candidatus Nanoarchaeia archaeon]
MMQKKAKEERAIVLEYLKHGYPEDLRPAHKKEPIAQVIGKSFFTLLEVVPSADLKPYDDVYVGEGKRDKILYIKGVLPYNKLTQTAKAELPFVIEKIIDENEAKFVQFFNKAGPISLRSHQFELLPGVGKKHAQELLAEREKGEFTSFTNIKERVASIDPKKAIVERIILELQGLDRHKLFTQR